MRTEKIDRENRGVASGSPDQRPPAPVVTSPGGAIMNPGGGVTKNAEPPVVAGVVVPRSRDRATGAAVARWAGGAVLLGHGLIHLMGVALLWHMGQPGDLRYSEVSPVAGSTAALAVGLLWLMSAALFVLAAGLLVVHRPRWRTVAFAAVVVSVPVLLPSASIAGMGLAVDAVVLLFVSAKWRSARRVWS